ncbi:hypothetical protein EMMF5_000926 [Cystobasidiomycetes sp. EMM_F5]
MAANSTVTPATTTSAESHSASTATTGGAKVGGFIKDIANVVHGAGEKIRGETLGAVDALGDAASGRPQGSVANRQSETNQSVSRRGDNEITSGLSGLRNA